MAASFSLPVTQDLFALRAKLQELLQFLREALSISNAHTVDFYTESVWEQLIDLPPEAVLGVLRKSAVEAEAEAEARVSEARLLSEAESPSGKRQVGGAGRERRLGAAHRSVSLAEEERKQVCGGAGGGGRTRAGAAEVRLGARRGGRGTFFRVLSPVRGSPGSVKRTGSRAEIRADRQGFPYRRKTREAALLGSAREARETGARGRHCRMDFYMTITSILDK